MSSWDVIKYSPWSRGKAVAQKTDNMLGKLNDRGGEELSKEKACPVPESGHTATAGREQASIWSHPH